MQMQLPQSLGAIADAFREAGKPVYLVGRAVRNGIMGLPCREYDLAGPLRPEAVARLFAGRPGFRVTPRAPRFGMVAIGVEENGRWAAAEYSAFRKDSYRIGHRSNAPEFTESLVEDASRRDYTMMAIYWDIDHGLLLDPTNGQRDIAARVIRTTSVDPIAVLGEDPLRLLRLVRMAADLRFDIEEGLWLSAQRMASRLLEVEPARIRDEWFRLLIADARYPMLGDPERSVAAGLRRLVDMRALTTFMPGWEEAVAAAIGLCAATPPLLTARFAALLHRGRGAAAVRGLLGPSGLNCPAEITQRVSRLVELEAVWRSQPSAAEVDKLFDAEGYALSADLVGLRAAVDAVTGERAAGLWRERLDARRKARIADPADRPALDGAAISRLAGESATRTKRMKMMMAQHLMAHPEDNHPDALVEVLRRVGGEG